MESAESLAPGEKQKPVNRIEYFEESTWTADFNHFSKPLKDLDIEHVLKRERGTPGGRNSGGPAQPLAP